jgi:hypothetical protein
VARDPVGTSAGSVNVAKANGDAPQGVATSPASAPTDSWAAPATRAGEAPDASEAADGATRSAAPAWTSPSLIGPNANAQLRDLAAALAQGASSSPTATADWATAPRRGAGGSAPGSPEGPPCSAGGSAAAGGGAASGAWAAVPVGPLACRPAHELRPNRLSTALWRPMVFLALQERPG